MAARLYFLTPAPLRNTKHDPEGDPPAHTLACPRGCVMAYKLQPWTSCPDVRSLSPPFIPQAAPCSPKHRLWCFLGLAPSSGVLGSWQLWTPEPGEAQSLHLVTQLGHLQGYAGELVASAPTGCRCSPGLVYVVFPIQGQRCVGLLKAELPGLNQMKPELCGGGTFSRASLASVLGWKVTSGL